MLESFLCHKTKDTRTWGRNNNCYLYFINTKTIVIKHERKEKREVLPPGAQGKKQGLRSRHSEIKMPPSTPPHTENTEHPAPFIDIYLSENLLLRNEVFEGNLKKYQKLF